VKWPELVAANVDAGTNVDLVVSTQAGFALLIGDGAGHFTLGTQKSVVSTAVGGAHVAVCDVNGNGTADVVVNTGTELDIFPGNGTGGFGIAFVVTPSSMAFAQVGCADLDSDGKMDLVVPGGGRSTLVLRGNGNFTFKPEEYYASNGVSTPPLLTDLTGDGHLDIVQDQDGTSVLVNDGTGHFLPSTTIKSAWSWSTTSGGRRHALAAADMDGDGKRDIIQSGGAGTFGLLLGNGDGTFPFQVGYTQGYTSMISGVADVNGDGHPDVLSLLSEGYNGGSVSVALSTPLTGCY
jgi:hypothetical protein